MTTVYSIRSSKSSATTTTTTTTIPAMMHGVGVFNSKGGGGHGRQKQQQQQQHYYSKPHTIQSGATLPSYTPLPPSPPHKHKHAQGGISNSSIGAASSLDSTLSASSRDVIVGDQWLVLSRIGEGSFGEVFEVQDIDTHRLYAIKREPLDVRSPQLKHESIMYDILAGGRGIPQCQWYGEHDDFACIVIDLLGPSLRELREAVSFISLDIVVQLGCQMISILEHIHSRGIVYRDVKPDNFLFPAQFYLPEYGIDMQDHPAGTDASYNLCGNGGDAHSPKPSCQEIFETWGISSSSATPMLSVVDFGLATWWRNPATNKPYPQSKRRIKNKTGTARYASLNVHRGKMHSRRDDIESLGYLLLDLILGSLPWTGIQARNSKAGWDRMKELKEETLLTDLCAGLPRGFLRFIEYARGLRFSDQPDYDYLRQLMRDSVDRNSGMSQLVQRGSSSNSNSSNVFTEEKQQQQQRLVAQPHQQQQQQHPPNSGGNNSRRNSNKRRPSIKTNHHPKLNGNNGKIGSSPVYNQEGVFMMDDLVQELSNMEEPQQQQQQQQQQRGGTGRRRRNSSRKLTMSKGSINNNNSNSRQQQHHHHHHHHPHESPPRRTNNNKSNAPPSPPSGSSFQKMSYPQQQHFENQGSNNKKRKGIGWNTHRHNNNKHHHPHHHHQQQQQQHPSFPHDATIYVKDPSWGEDRPDALWGNYQPWL